MKKEKEEIWFADQNQNSEALSASDELEPEEEKVQEPSEPEFMLGNGLAVEEPTDLEELEEAEKPESLEEEAEMGVLEEQEIAEDPVRMYLREIGRVRLLTAEDEKALSKRMAEGKRVKEIQQEWHKQSGNAPTAAETMLALLMGLVKAWPTLKLMQEQQAIKPAHRFVGDLFDSRLRNAIDAALNPEMVQAMAAKGGKPVQEVEQALINISIDSNVLPQDIIAIIGKKASVSNVDKLT